MQGAGAVGPVACPTRRPHVPFTVRTDSCAKTEHTQNSIKRKTRRPRTLRDRCRRFSRLAPCCHEAVSAPGHGGGSGEDADRMAHAATTPQSPRHMHKRRRLSRLLDKLAVQFNNNNQYPSKRWLMYNAQSVEPSKESDDVPLDLSIKSEIIYSPPAPESEPFICPACGQTFALQDRLAKHVASRHRNRTPESARAYECNACLRKFSRSDMLTRHARLHSGVKPYSCPTCKQVFSRSDHLATHQRTHTGEKPYRCPMCPYAACRRDMITRHMKTHTRRPKPV